MQKTVIIVPCYNEAQRLKVQEFIDYSKNFESIHFIFIDDGSTDDTSEILDQLCKSNPNQMLYIHLERNMGKAEAIRTGILKAFERDYLNIGYWDADLATPLNVINQFCKLLESPKLTMILGSRVRLLGRKIARRPMRHYLGRVFATCASIVLGLPVYDTQCGAKMFRNNDELRHVFLHPFKVRWIFDVEVLARLITMRKATNSVSMAESIVEYPLEEWEDIPGSKLKVRDFFVAVFELFTIFLLLRSSNTNSRYRKKVSS